MHSKKISQKIMVVLLFAIVMFSTVFFATFNISASTDDTTYTGNVSVQTYLNVRSGPSTSYNSLGTLENGDLVYIYEKTDNNWYKIAYGDSYGYISGDYVINVREILKYDINADFETNLENQKFPESYKILLRQLHEQHPNWIFMADHLSMTWEEAIAAESGVGVSLVQDGYNEIPDSWKSMAQNAYDWNNNYYIPYDSGNWVTAEREVVEYFVEPRNFLNENYIYMFLEQGYNPNIQTKEGLQLILNGTFMEGAFPENTHSTYADVIMEAAQNTGVSPYILAASIIIEQGSNGQGSSISGTIDGYNYYNYYNIGAYAHSGNTAVTNGIIFASGNGSFGRPWDTRAKAIIGGAEYYSSSFLNRGQDTLYYKKFNVITPTYYQNQYMSNVLAAYNETSELNDAYSGVDDGAVLTFSIPVYREMPETNSTYLPTSNGANNYYITSLSVNGTALDVFSMFNNYYEANIDAHSITVSATVPSGATVYGTGTVNLMHGKNNIDLTVTAASGKTATYTLVVNANLYSWHFENGNWYCYNIYGNKHTGWACLDGIWYFMNESGIMQTGWQLIGDDWFYFHQNGGMQDGWLNLDGNWYFIKLSGGMQTGWQFIGENWYYFSSNGIMQTGWLNLDGIWYYFNQDGSMATDWQLIGENRYYFQQNGAMHTGWLNLDDIWYYFNDFGAMQTDWKLIGDDWFYFHPDGTMLTGWLNLDGNWYFIKLSGGMQTGWQFIGENWYYFNSNGIMQIGWLNLNGTWYYLSDSGAMHIGWLELDETWYFFNQSGEMQIGWVTIEDKKYLFDNSGHYVEGAHSFVIDISKWQGDIDWDKLSKTNIDAIILRSSHGGTTTENYGNSKDTKFDEYLENLKRLNIPYGIYHYNTATTVEMAEIQAQNIINILKDSGANPTLPVFVDIEQDGGSCDLISIAKVYISKFISNGYKPGIYANENYWNNYLNDPELNVYYKWIANYGINDGYPSAIFSQKDGIENYIMWQYTSVGEIDGINENTVDFNVLFDWYFKPDGWQEISGKRYHYSNGYLTYGWFFENNNWYYLKSSGEMAVDGWQNLDDTWYYFDENGVMQTGWIYLNDIWYYLKDGGSMATGWLNSNGIWYYLDQNGAMLTGWQYIGNHWYYFLTNGVMHTGWLNTDQTWYYLKDTGDMQTSWINLGGIWYYMNNSGEMVTDWQLIDGTWYYFNASGAMQIGWINLNGTWYYLYDSGAMATNIYISGGYIDASGVWHI